MKIILLLILIFVSAPVSAERTRLYDTSKGYPKYIGYAEKQHNNTYRFYDSKGLYTGRMDNERVYSKDGKVIQKLYLLPNNLK